jgi:DNA repair photolyase
MLQINPKSAKSILIKSGLPGSDWVINPYNGCEFGCMYCYAAQIARWNHPGQVWGSYIDVKINAAEILENELIQLQKKTGKKDFGSIFLSSVTDPYTNIETKYRITRKCLEKLRDFGYEGSISVQTKSTLILRDIDIFKKLKKFSVGFTITSLDDNISRFLEVHAPSVTSRLESLKVLYHEGIKTYAFVGPILPNFLNNNETLDQLLDALQECGVGSVWFEHINLSPKIKARLFDYLRKNSPDLIPIFREADTLDYRNKLDLRIIEAMQQRKMTLGLSHVIFHHNLPIKAKLRV